MKLRLTRVSWARMFMYGLDALLFLKLLQMMEEIFLHLSGSNSALPAMVQILADFASSDGMSLSLVSDSKL